MKNSSSRKMRNARRIFTLVELLITIAIIAILAALLLPALQSARNKGIAVRCSGNLRQLGQEMHMYSNDFDCRVQTSSFSGSLDTDGKYGKWTTTWFYGRAVPDTVFCPSYELPSAADRDTYTKLYTYAVKSRNWERNGIGICPAWENIGYETNFNNAYFEEPGQIDGKGWMYVHFSRLKKASQYFMITESAAFDRDAFNGKPITSLGNMSWVGFHFRHEERINMLFADGHTIAAKYTQLHYSILGNCDYWATKNKYYRRMDWKNSYE